MLQKVKKKSAIIRVFSIIEQTYFQRYFIDIS